MNGLEVLGYHGLEVNAQIIQKSNFLLTELHG